ncbi:MAG: hypothetical protein AAGF11_01930 [Myxococcota bacterium]
MISPLVSVLAVSGPSVGEVSVLSWDAPASCATASRVQERLDALLGEVPVDPTVRARARVVAVPDGFEVTLALWSPTGFERRRIVAERCDVLAEAVVFVVAVAIDPVAVAQGAAQEDRGASLIDPSAAKQSSPEAVEVEPAESEPRADPEPAPTPETEPAPLGDAPEPAPSREARRGPPESDRDHVPSRSSPVPLAGVLRLATGVGVGVLPTLDVVFGVAGALRGRSFRVELGAQHGFARPVRLPATDSAGADLDQWTLLGRGCWARPARRVEVDLCGQLETGAVRARGVGVEQARTRWSSFVSLGAAAGLAVSLYEPLALWVDVQGYGSVRRPRFGVAGADAALYSAAVGGFRVGLGLEVSLGDVRKSRGPTNQ